MGDITIRIDTVQVIAIFSKSKSGNPLVSVVNCYEVQPIRHSKKLCNICAVLLKDTDCGTMNYGRASMTMKRLHAVYRSGAGNGSDDDGSLHQPVRMGPDVPSRTIAAVLCHIIKEYSYFSYNANEHCTCQNRSAKCH